MAASLDSRFEVSPAVSCPLFTPFAMRSCWFSLRPAMVGCFCVDVVVPEPCVDEPLDDVSCPSATLPNHSTAAGTTIHFESLLLMTRISLSFACSIRSLGSGNTQVWRKSCGLSTGLWCSFLRGDRAGITLYAQSRGDGSALPRDSPS